MTDRIATEAPISSIVQTPGSVGSVAVESQPVISPPQPPAHPQVTAEAPPVQEISLREKYAGLAARYRELGNIQFKTGLNNEELSEKQRLEEMASLGLFEQGLSPPIN